MIHATISIPMSALMPRHERQAEIEATYEHDYEQREPVLPPMSHLYIEFECEMLPDHEHQSDKFIAPCVLGESSWPLKNARLVYNP